MRRKEHIKSSNALIPNCHLAGSMQMATRLFKKMKWLLTQKLLEMKMKRDKRQNRKVEETKK